jgi:hypothetical protein
MELLLWRHAKAEDSVPDHARELTRTGWEQARRVVAWLKEHGKRWNLPPFHKGALWWISGEAGEPARLRQIVEGAKV